MHIYILIEILYQSSNDNFIGKKKYVYNNILQCDAHVVSEQYVISHSALINHIRYRVIKINNYLKKIHNKSKTYKNTLFPYHIFFVTII